VVVACANEEDKEVVSAPSGTTVAAYSGLDVVLEQLPAAAAGGEDGKARQCTRGEG